MPRFACFVFLACFIVCFDEAVGFVVKYSRSSVERLASEQQPTTAKVKTRRNFCVCRLFFRPANVENPLASWKVPENVCKELSSANLTLPYSIELEANGVHSGSKGSSSAEIPPVLTIRAIRSTEDVAAIADMCVQEYGTVGPASFPFDNPSLIPDWLDREGLRILVYLMTVLKIMPKRNYPQDHAVLVSAVDDTIMGMIEVSRQPVLPERNPPPYPIPLALKQAFGFVTNTKVQGWITNLLIVPEYRGQGYSKVLVAACEGLASAWRCSSIHLHCDADRSNGGKIPQKLYERLGYSMIQQDTNDDKFAWMMNNVKSSIFMIEGVPLLYLRKDL